MHYSTTLDAVCCELCHCAAEPSPSAPIKLPRVTARRFQPEPYARLVDRVWSALEREGTVFTPADGSGRLFGYCPACGTATITIQVLDRPARVRTDGCRGGCSAQLVAAALR